MPIFLLQLDARLKFAQKLLHSLERILHPLKHVHQTSLSYPGVQLENNATQKNPDKRIE